MHDEVSAILLEQLGGQRRSYQREKVRALRNMVSEVYSPPRITKQLANSKNEWLVPGFSLDLTVKDSDDGKPWDFTNKAQRDQAKGV